MAGLQDYNASELDLELPELLTALNALEINFPSVDKLLDRLRQPG